MIDERERKIAIREAEQIAAEESYFGSRHHSIDTRDRRSVFGAAFRMAWESVESLQSQLAAANERADRYKEFWEATLLDCREAGERADVKAAAHSDMAEMYRKEKERADGLQKIVDAARRPWADVVSYIVRDICELDVPPSNHPRCVIVDIDDVTAILHAAAPVLSQPAVVPTYEIVMSSGRKARLTAPELVDRLAACTVEIERLRGERKTRPAVVPEGLANAVLANIAAIAHCGGLAKLDNENALSNIRQLSKPWCDNTGTLRDLKNRVDAAILSATEGRKDE